MNIIEIVSDFLFLSEKGALGNLRFNCFYKLNRPKLTIQG